MDSPRRQTGCSLPTHFPHGTNWKPHQGSSSRSHILPQEATARNPHTISFFLSLEAAGGSRVRAFPPPSRSQPPLPEHLHVHCSSPRRRPWWLKSEASPAGMVPWEGCIGKRRSSPRQLGFISTFNKQTNICLMMAAGTKVLDLSSVI